MAPRAASARASRGGAAASAATKAAAAAAAACGAGAGAEASMQPFAFLAPQLRAAMEGLTSAAPPSWLMAKAAAAAAGAAAEVFASAGARGGGRGGRGRSAGRGDRRSRSRSGGLSPVVSPLAVMPYNLSSRTGEASKSIWRCDFEHGVDVRADTEIDAEKTGQALMCGEIFRVSEERQSPDGIVYLCLDDGRGWVYDRMPGIGVLCVRQRAAGLVNVVESRRRRPIATPLRQRGGRRAATSEPQRDLTASIDGASFADSDMAAAPDETTPIAPKRRGHSSEAVLAGKRPAKVAVFGHPSEAVCAASPEKLSRDDQSENNSSGSGRKTLDFGAWSSCKPKTDLSPFASLLASAQRARQDAFTPGPEDKHFAHELPEPVGMEVPPSPGPRSPEVDVAAPTAAVAATSAGVAAEAAAGSAARAAPAPMPAGALAPIAGAEVAMCQGASAMSSDIWAQIMATEEAAVTAEVAAAEAERFANATLLQDVRMLAAQSDQNTADFRGRVEALRWLQQAGVRDLDGMCPTEERSSLRMEQDAAAAELTAAGQLKVAIDNVRARQHEADLEQRRADEALGKIRSGAVEQILGLQEHAGEVDRTIVEQDERLQREAARCIEGATRAAAEAERRSRERAAQLEAWATEQRKAWGEKVVRTEALLESVSELAAFEHRAHEEADAAIRSAQAEKDEAHFSADALAEAARELLERARLVQRNISARAARAEDGARTATAEFEHLKEQKSDAEAWAELVQQEAALAVEEAREQSTVAAQIVQSLEEKEEELKVCVQHVIEDSEGMATVAEMQVAEMEVEVAEAMGDARADRDRHLKEHAAHAAAADRAAAVAEAEGREAERAAGQVEELEREAIVSARQQRGEVLSKHHDRVVRLEREVAQAVDSSKWKIQEVVALALFAERTSTDTTEAAHLEAQRRVASAQAQALAAERRAGDVARASEELLAGVEQGSSDLLADAEHQAQIKHEEARRQVEAATMQLTTEERALAAAVRQAGEEAARCRRKAARAQDEARASEEGRQVAQALAEAAEARAAQRAAAMADARQDAARVAQVCEESASAAEAQAQQETDAAKKACENLCREAAELAADGEAVACAAERHAAAMQQHASLTKQATVRASATARRNFEAQVKLAEEKALNAERAVQDAMDCSRRSQTVLSTYFRQALQERATGSPAGAAAAAWKCPAATPRGGAAAGAPASASRGEARASDRAQGWGSLRRSVRESLYEDAASGIA